jgi:hypothetical protein
MSIGRSSYFNAVGGRRLPNVVNMSYRLLGFGETPNQRSIDYTTTDDDRHEESDLEPQSTTFTEDLSRIAVSYRQARQRHAGGRCSRFLWICFGFPRNSSKATTVSNTFAGRRAFFHDDDLQFIADAISSH